MQTNKRICFFIDGSFFAWSTLYTDYKICEFNMSINLFTNAHYKDFEMVFFILFINGIPLHYRIQWRISPFPGLIKGGCIWSLRNPSSYNCFTQHVYVTRMEKAVSAKNVLKKRIFKHWHYMNAKNYLHLT